MKLMIELVYARNDRAESLAKPLMAEEFHFESLGCNLGDELAVCDTSKKLQRQTKSMQFGDSKQPEFCGILIVETS